MVVVVVVVVVAAAPGLVLGSDQTKVGETEHRE